MNDLLKSIRLIKISRLSIELDKIIIKKRIAVKEQNYELAIQHRNHQWELEHLLEQLDKQKNEN